MLDTISLTPPTCIINLNNCFLVLGRDRSYFVKSHSDSTKKFFETDIINMLEFLIDNIFVLNICVTNDHGYVPLVVNTSQSFPHSWLITGFVARLTRRVSQVKQELLTLPEHLCSPPVLSGVRVTRSLVLYVCFVDRCLSFCTFFLLVIVLSVLLQYTDSDYPFGIFKLFWIWMKYLSLEVKQAISQSEC